MSHVIDVRLQKVLAFGERASAIHPLTLMDRSSFHRTDWAAIAHWEDGQIKEVASNERHPQPRWRVKLDGELKREPDIELSPSFDVPGMSLMVRSFNLGKDLVSIDGLQSTLCISSHSARQTSALQPTRGECLSWARFGSQRSKRRRTICFYITFSPRFAIMYIPRTLMQMF